MGLFSSYLAYRYGKRRAAKRARAESFDDYEVCDLCGFERRFHADDDDETCPEPSV
jgi:hypothetical protein